MTNIVAFVPRRRRKQAAPEQPCEILFFTGVRYFRADPPVPQKRRKLARNPRKKRA